MRRQRKRRGNAVASPFARILGWLNKYITQQTDNPPIGLEDMLGLKHGPVPREVLTGPMIPTIDAWQGGWTAGRWKIYADQLRVGTLILPADPMVVRYIHSVMITTATSVVVNSMFFVMRLGGPSGNTQIDFPSVPIMPSINGGGQVDGGFVQAYGSFVVPPNWDLESSGNGLQDISCSAAILYLEAPAGSKVI